MKKSKNYFLCYEDFFHDVYRLLSFAYKHSHMLYFSEFINVQIIVNMSYLCLGNCFWRWCRFSETCQLNINHTFFLFIYFLTHCLSHAYIQKHQCSHKDRHKHICLNLRLFLNTLNIILVDSYIWVNQSFTNSVVHLISVAEEDRMWSRMIVRQSRI